MSVVYPCTILAENQKRFHPKPKNTEEAKGTTQQKEPPTMPEPQFLRRIRAVSSFFILLLSLSTRLPEFQANAFVPAITTGVPRMPTHSRTIMTASHDRTRLEASRGGGDEIIRPKLIIFDLDGCLWRPEMYELIHFMGNRGAPFRPSEEDKNILVTVGGQPVQLLKDVRDVMREIYSDPQWNDVLVGISSRTDAPHWARELLSKFTVHDSDGGDFVLSDVFQGGPIEISYESKVKHFQRISRHTNIGFQDMVFFDNEFGNCQSIASLGVTVGYCPGGVCRGIWEKTLEAYSSSSSLRQGTIVEL
jgi:magnesium-dependent phosphatase 1